MTDLTQKQRETLEYIMFFIEYHGYPPKLKDLGFKFSVHITAIRDRLTWLEKKGYIVFDEIGRCIRVLRNPDGNEVRIVFEVV